MFCLRRCRHDTAPDAPSLLQSELGKPPVDVCLPCVTQTGFYLIDPENHGILQVKGKLLGGVEGRETLHRGDHFLNADHLHCVGHHQGINHGDVGTLEEDSMIIRCCVKHEQWRQADGWQVSAVALKHGWRMILCTGGAHSVFRVFYEHALSSQQSGRGFQARHAGQAPSCRGFSIPSLGFVSDCVDYDIMPRAEKADSHWSP